MESSSRLALHAFHSPSLSSRVRPQGRKGRKRKFAIQGRREWEQQANSDRPTQKSGNNFHRALSSSFPFNWIERAVNFLPFPLDRKIRATEPKEEKGPTYASYKRGASSISPRSPSFLLASTPGDSSRESLESRMQLPNGEKPPSLLHQPARSKVFPAIDERGSRPSVVDRRGSCVGFFARAKVSSLSREKSWATSILFFDRHPTNPLLFLFWLRICPFSTKRKRPL